VPEGQSVFSVFRALALGLGDEPAEIEASWPVFREGALISRIAGLAALKRYDEALDALDPAWLTSARIDLLLFQPAFDPMRSDARFTRVLATLGLTEAHARAQAWRAAHPPEKAARN
jgi:hypothetical protein